MQFAAKYVKTTMFFNQTFLYIVSLCYSYKTDIVNKTLYLVQITTATICLYKLGACSFVAMVLFLHLYYFINNFRKIHSFSVQLFELLQ